MCGHDWCTVRICKEITEFTSGKDPTASTGTRAVKSPALNAEQREILERRGILPVEEIVRLASKTARAVGAAPGTKSACHSDVADSTDAQRLHEERLGPLPRA